MIDAAEFKLLRSEFERMRPMLLQIGRQVDQQGAWARAMLHFVPVFLLLLESERKAQIPPRRTFEGVACMVADLARHTIRCTVGPAERLSALDQMLGVINELARPRLMKTEGGVMLPSQMIQ